MRGNGSKAIDVVSTIRLSISDRDVMRELSPSGVKRILQEVGGRLSETDVRNFIYRCFLNRETQKGLAAVDGTIQYWERTGGGEDALKLVGAAVSTLSVLQESMPELKPRLSEILSHRNPAVVACALNSLVRSSNLESLYRVYDFLENDQFQVFSAAVKYVENCARDAAFRKRPGTYFLDDEAEAFLRSALVPLEECYARLKERNENEYLQKRLSVLVVVVYSEILNSMDWKFFQGEQSNQNAYAAMQQFFFEELAKEALGNLLKAACRSDQEESTKVALLHAIGRISNERRFKLAIHNWIYQFRAVENRRELLKLVADIELSCIGAEDYDSIPWTEQMVDRSSIVPRQITKKKQNIVE